MDDLNANIKDLEKMNKQREDIEEWIDKQQILVAEWTNRPVKLRPESLKQDLFGMNELLNQIGDKRTFILMELSTSRK